MPGATCSWNFSFKDAFRAKRSFIIWIQRICMTPFGLPCNLIFSVEFFSVSPSTVFHNPRFNSPDDNTLFTQQHYKLDPDCNGSMVTKFEGRGGLENRWINIREKYNRKVSPDCYKNQFFFKLELECCEWKILFSSFSILIFNTRVHKLQVFWPCYT